MAYTIPILYSDTYKQCHPRMYPEGTTQLVSYWVPRRSMLEADKMVFFGLQAFIKDFLINSFNHFFFKIDIDLLQDEYYRIMDRHLGENTYEWDRVKALHSLGYLPLSIRALPEGTMVPMGVPCIEITNTHPDFAWVVQWVECILQSELWKPCVHATMATWFRNVADAWYEKTSDGDPEMAMADFGMRGMSGIEEAVKASAAWLTSFRKTSTIPTIGYIEQYYGECPGGVGIGAISTEHSVMSANYAVDGDEITFVKRLLTELYPNSSFSMVSDTYDYWNMVENIIPACKNEILAHNGKLLIRPDSGDIVSIAVTTVLRLWDTFGGTINSKGYKVLDPHIGVIYGDGCTIDRVKKIYEKLEKYGFAADNIVFGIGAFSFAALLDEDGKMNVYTRDTFGIAMKATCAKVNGETLFLYKDPKTDTSHLKKSHKGCVNVFRDENGILKAEDGYEAPIYSKNSAFIKVFEDGKLLNDEYFGFIRERVNKERLEG